jgi:DNA-binding transcriptional regulator YiaG
MAREQFNVQLDGLSSPVNGRARRVMAKASLPDVRKADQDELREQIGRAVRSARGELSLKEFAAAIDRDERQVARWEEGKERPHVDALLAVPAFYARFTEALARLSDEIEVETVIRIRRSA